MDMIVKKSSKDWWKDLVVYQIYPKSFKDSNGDGIGDFGGIIEKLDYVKSVGVNAIWLSPVYPTPFVDNGYDISDYQDIEPTFGNMQQFEQYVKLCHEKGIYVIMDLVVNHTSDQHKWFLESKKSKDNPYADYYIWQDPVDGHEPNRWGSSFGGSSWTYVKERDQYYLHLFSSAQPDLNWKNPKVQEEVLSMIEWWCQKGVDGFRVDAISYLEKCDFSTHSDILEANGYEMPMVINSGRPGTHALISKMRTEVWDKYDAMTVGEVSCRGLEDHYRYCSDSRKEFNMAIPYVLPLIEINTWSPSKMKKDIWAIYETLKEDGWWARFLSNHDKPRQVSLYGNDKEYWKESAKLLGTITDLLPGTPFVFQGEEIGMTDVDYTSIKDFRDIDTFNVYNVDVANGKSEEEAFLAAKRVSRDNARSPMQWNQEKNAGFSSVEPWMAVNANHQSINVESEEKDPDSILNYYRSLLALRRENKTLRRGDLTFLDMDCPWSFSYLRRLDEEEFVVLSNFSKESHDYAFDYDAYSLLLSNYQKEEVMGQNLTLRPYEVMVLKKN